MLQLPYDDIIYSDIDLRGMLFVNMLLWTGAFSLSTLVVRETIFMNKNFDKYDAYKAMKESLRKAMKQGFYYQAIFIEYAIIEDRTLSALKHAGVKYQDNKGHDFKLAEKIRRMRGNQAFSNSYVRKRITLELLDDIYEWKQERDRLIHALAKIPYNHESIKDIAERGQEIVRVLDNKVKSVNHYYDKMNAERPESLER